MPLPIDNLTTVNLDAATDDPSQARAELLATVNKVKELLARLGYNAMADTIPVHDSNGNIQLGRVVGIGTAPDTDHDPTSTAVQEFGDWGEVHVRTDGAVEFMRNAKFVAGAYVRRNAGTASNTYYSSAGTITMYTAIPGVAGSIISWTDRLNIPNDVGQPISLDGFSAAANESPNTIALRNSSGNINARSFFTPATNALTIVRSVLRTDTGITTFQNFAGSSAGWNAVTPCLTVGVNSGSRSINTGGTINASGADYAEYETKRDDCGDIKKGDIVGYDKDGRLTDRWERAISFGIKSTDPSYVGGDSWGNEDSLGCKIPMAPKKLEYPMNSSPEEMSAIDEAHKCCVEDYEKEKAKFDELLECARQKVDRIAYSGKVPCNVTGAKPGDYIVPVEAENGGITGKAVTEDEITFSEYRLAVGRVRNILDDGRPMVAVMVH